jgi:NurA-like 5'-3' nuclease
MNEANKKNTNDLSLVSLLEKRKNNIGSLEVVRYEVQMINGQPKIVISQVKVLDTNGKYIKFAKLKDVNPYLSKYPISFKQLS